MLLGDDDDPLSCVNGVHGDGSKDFRGAKLLRGLPLRGESLEFKFKAVRCEHESCILELCGISSLGSTFAV